MAGHSFQRCESRGRHLLLLLTAAGASCSRLATPFSLSAARSLLPLLAPSVPSVPGNCHFRLATKWQRPPSPWEMPAGKRRRSRRREGCAPSPPSRPRAGKGRASLPGTSRAHSASAGPFSPRAESTGKCPPCPRWPPPAATARARGRRGRRRSR